MKRDWGQRLSSSQAAYGILKDLGHDEYRSNGHWHHEFHGWVSRKCIELNQEGVYFHHL